MGWIRLSTEEIEKGKNHATVLVDRTINLAGIECVDHRAGGGLKVRLVSGFAFLVRPAEADRLLAALGFADPTPNA